jgi:predicted transposase YdaD
MSEKKSDIGGKRLVSLSPEAWVRWLTQKPEISVREILSSEFQWISRANDSLIKVCSPDREEFLVLNELQLRYTNKMPLRINAYAALATERYNLPVFPVLINILPNSQNEKIPSVYHSEILGMMAHQDYRVINLWEVDVNLVFEQQLTALLPFVPILKGGGNEAKVRQAVQSLRANETLAELEPLLSFFASFVLDIPLVQQIMRWDMVVLSESPWYQEIMKEGEKLGMQQGESSLILRQISRRFGAIEPSLELKIKGLSLPDLESLGEALLDFRGMADFQNWLKGNEIKS